MQLWRYGRVVTGALALADPGCGLFFAARAQAADVPIPVRVYINRTASKTKFVAKGTFALADQNSENPVSQGGSLTFTSGPTSDTVVLAAGGWSALGSPPGAKGFRYTDSTGASCKKVVVTGTVIKGLCKPTAAAAPPYNSGSDPPISIVLSIGSALQRYCGECPNGGVQKGNPTLLTKLDDCNAPSACPAETPTPTDTPIPTFTSTATATPVPCGGTAPNCGGECPPGQVCGTFGNNTCGCAAAGACGFSSPTCDGDCPPGEACFNTQVGCLCVGSNCGTYPMCDGSCPAGGTCIQFTAPNPALDSCLCISEGP